MTFDLFAPLEEEAPEPALESPPASPVETPPVERVWTRPRLEAGEPCGSDARGARYYCGVGGGQACGSMDAGRTWFCMGHRPWGWLPLERDPEDKPRRVTG